MKVKGVECPHCLQQIWSRSRYDFRHCDCGKTFVDGGSCYLRYGGDPQPEIVDIETGKELQRGGPML